MWLSEVTVGRAVGRAAGFRGRRGRAQGLVAQVSVSRGCGVGVSTWGYRARDGVAGGGAERSGGGSGKKVEVDHSASLI